MCVSPSSIPLRSEATASRRLASSMYQVPCPMTETCRSVAPNCRVATLFLLNAGELPASRRRVPCSHAPEALVERIAHPAHRPDRVALTAALQRFAQASDMNIDRALVDIDVAAPNRV